MAKMTVVAARGAVPTEENSRRFIGKEPVEVEMSAYYRRRMLDGELVEVKPETPKTKVKPVVSSAPAPAPAATDLLPKEGK